MQGRGCAECENRRDDSGKDMGEGQQRCGMQVGKAGEDREKMGHGWDREKSAGEKTGGLPYSLHLCLQEVTLGAQSLLSSGVGKDSARMFGEENCPLLPGAVAQGYADQAFMTLAEELAHVRIQLSNAPWKSTVL